MTTRLHDQTKVLKRAEENADLIRRYRTAIRGTGLIYDPASRVLPYFWQNSSLYSLASIQNTVHLAAMASFLSSFNNILYKGSIIVVGYMSV